MKITWTSRARRDMNELIAYLAEHSIQAAHIVVGRIRKSLTLLGSNPLSGRKGRVSETRELVVTRTPYILVYRIRSGSVHILRAYHGARRWPSRFD